MLYICEKIIQPMIRKVVVPNEALLSIPLPASYVGREVEVLAFTVGEDTLAPRKKTMKFNAFDLDLRGFKFDREEANAR